MREWQVLSPKETAAKVIDWLPAVMACPGTEHVLEGALEPAENLLLMQDGEALAWIGICKGDEFDTLDIAVRSDLQGKWLTRETIREAGEFIFKNRNCVLLENSKGKAQKFALQMGANPFIIPGKKDTYLLSKASFYRRVN